MKTLKEIDEQIKREIGQHARAVFAIIDSPKNETGDEWVDTFETLEKATSFAESSWDRLTKREKEKRIIEVGIISMSKPLDENGNTKEDEEESPFAHISETELDDTRFYEIIKTWESL